MKQSELLELLFQYESPDWWFLRTGNVGFTEIRIKEHRITASQIFKEIERLKCTKYITPGSSITGLREGLNEFYARDRKSTEKNQADLSKIADEISKGTRRRKVSDNMWLELLMEHQK